MDVQMKGDLVEIEQLVRRRTRERYSGGGER
jgi:hypothetical protein